MDGRGSDSAEGETVSTDWSLACQPRRLLICPTVWLEIYRETPILPHVELALLAGKIIKSKDDRLQVSRPRMVARDPATEGTH